MSSLVVYGCAILAGDMTVVLALLGENDIVVATDGLARGDNDQRACETYTKSWKLNSELCLACSRQSNHMQRIMAAIDPRAAVLGVESPIQEWQAKGWTYSGTYAQAKAAGSGEYRRLVAEVTARWRTECEQQMQHEDYAMSSFLLAGREGGTAITTMDLQSRDGGQSPRIREYRKDEPGVTAFFLGLQHYPELAKTMTIKAVGGDLVCRVS